jgi:phenylpropionate dioxygenase-like ring-hydroxylating dioxygenase large terminal subunit
MARREDEHTQLAIPNGWYAVGWSRQLIDGDVTSIHYFGEDLVLFRTRSGEARVLDAWCAHLGAHLGEGGRVVGESIQCPYHAWEYAGDTGECSKIPYCSQIPKKARVRTWEVRERNGFIFVWYHAKGQSSSWEVPVLEEVGHPDWTTPREEEIEIPIHVQDIHENNNDPVHFQVVHGMSEAMETEPAEYSADGRIYKLVGHTERETAMGTFKTTLVRESFSIGMSTVRTIGIPGAGLLLFSSTTPIEPNLTISRWMITVTKNLVDLIGEEFQRQLVKGVQDDLQIWTNKIHRKNPVLCKEDGFLGEYRQWVKQFYV